MGLDMYLKKRVYVGGEYADNTESEKEVSFDFIKFGRKEEFKFKIGEMSEIIAQVGYWRKANHIHKWFVDNIQQGEDDCKEYYVPIDKLKELHNICSKILNTKNKKKQLELAKQELPVQKGFFFGSAEVDEWYFSDLKDTVTIIDDIMKSPDYERHDYYYRASW